MNTRSLLLAIVTLFALSGAAHADADWRKNLYIKGGVGWSSTNDTDYSSGGSAFSTSYDNGYIAEAALGFDHGNQFRTEFEISRRVNDVEDNTLSGVALANPNGSINATSFMVNGYYDIATGTPFTPYLGVGAGLAKISLDSFNAGTTTLVDENDTVFAYQVIAGAEYAVNTDFSVFTEYKFMGTDDVEFTTTGLTNNEEAYHNHTVTAGLKYNFN